MAVETLSEFPSTLIAGDTLKATIANSRFSSADWRLSVVLKSGTQAKSFKAAVGTGTGFLLTIAADQSAKLTPGVYSISYVYTDIATGERTTEMCGDLIRVFADPTTAGTKSIARQTLEALQEAFRKISKNPRLSVNFGGETYTNRNLKELQEAIARQEAIVQSEDASLIPSGDRSTGRILHPI